MKVEFCESVDDSLLKYAVIISKTDGKWVYCKHKMRDTYEIPGGTREKGEDILTTAKRELYEETGAIRFSMIPVCVYSVDNGTKTYGMLYYAEIEEFEAEIHSEIEKRIISESLPEKWTYPLIQPILIKEAQRRNIIK